MTVKNLHAIHTYSGLSSDTKPTSPPAGSTFLETDTKQLHIYNGTEWVTKYGEEFDRTIYPIRAQGTTGGVAYSSTGISTTTSGDDVTIWDFDTSKYFSRLAGNLAWVSYDINLQLKAASTSADLTWQLQARDVGSTAGWVDMCAAQTETDILTSYVPRTIQGYLDIESTGVSLMPFEMQLILQSSEPSIDWLDSFSLTWSTEAPGGSGECRAMKEFDDNLYASIGDTIYYSTGDDSWSACSGSMGQVRCFELSDVASSGTDTFYAVTNTTVKKSTGTAWTAIPDSPDDCWSILHDNGSLYIGRNNGTVVVSTDGNSWGTDTGLTEGSPVRALVKFGTAIYAGLTNGEVWKYEDTSWTEVGDLSSKCTQVYSLCEYNSSLYVGTGDAGDVLVLNSEGTAWADTGNLGPGNTFHVWSLLSYDKGTQGEVLYAGTANISTVYYFSGDGWTDSPKFVGEISVLCLAGYSVNDTIYCGTAGNAKIGKGSITQTWISGEGTGRVKNDTVIRVVGEVG